MRVRCEGSPAPCVDTFEMFADTHAYGGEPYAPANDVDGCKARCLALEACVAFDFNGGCYVHLSASNLDNINNRPSAAGIDHYRRRPNTNCGTPSPGMVSVSISSGEKTNRDLPLSEKNVTFGTSFSSC